MQSSQPFRRSLVVFLENGGGFGHLALPPAASRAFDYWCEVGARVMLSALGVNRFWHEIRILEDQRAQPEELLSTLVGLSQRSAIDLLVLAHGTDAGAVGWQGTCLDQGFLHELQAVQVDRGLPVKLRCVYTIACRSGVQAAAWLAAGAHAVNGICGDNWLPIPTLPLFIHQWQSGLTFAEAAVSAHLRTLHWARTLVPEGEPWRGRIEASRQFVVGNRDVRLVETFHQIKTGLEPGLQRAKTRPSQPSR